MRQKSIKVGARVKVLAKGTSLGKEGVIMATLSEPPAGYGPIDPKEPKGPLLAVRLDGMGHCRHFYANELRIA